MSDSSESLNRSSENTIYNLMSNSRRRHIIWCLAIADGWTLTIRQVASHIVAFEESEIPIEMNRDTVTDMNTQLKRRHVEPLEDAAIITLNGDTIQPGPRFFDVLHIMRICEESEYNWQQSDESR